MVVHKVLIPLLLVISVATLGINARFSSPPILQNKCYHRYTTHNTISHSHNNKYSRYYTTKTTSNIVNNNIQHNSILQIRGGNIFGTSKSDDDEEYEYEYYEVVDDNTSNSDDSEYYYEEEDTDYLLSTPIPSDTVKESHESQNQVKNKEIAVGKKQQAVAEQKRLQKEEKKRKLIEKKRLAAAKHKRDTKARQKKNENEYLLETPATENKPRKSQSKRRSSRRSQWLPQSSSKTSSALIPPSGGITNRGRSFSSIKSYNYSAILSSLSTILTKSIIQPIKNILSSITNKLISIISNYISILWSLIINTFDYVWYGPVNGVTTTGIVNRHGGLQSLLFNTQIGITISYIVGLTLLSVLITKLWNIKPIGDDDDSDEDSDDAYYVDPPTVEEELRFLHHDFDARNPLAKERIAKVITKKQNRFSLPERRRRDMKKDNSPRGRKGRRKHAIESIQSWWKERPGQRSISIIEPQHLRNPQHTKTQSQESLKGLQKQLMKSEQEREIMSRDIRDLKHDLQKAHDDSRSIVSQNKWLEKQTSQIIEAEQQQRNGSSSSEMDRARASVKGVLDRERTRRFAENERKNQLGRGYNDLDLDNTRRDTRLADYELPNNLAKGFNDLDLNSLGRDASRRFDGVRITREIDKNDEFDAM